MCNSRSQSPRRQVSLDESVLLGTVTKKPPSAHCFYTAGQVSTFNGNEGGGSSSPARRDHQHERQLNNVVTHDYHDHSDDINRDYIVDHVARGGVVTPFPIKLHQMLDQAQKDGHSDLVSWQPHGRCFVVHKPKEFADEVMPTHFKQCTKLPSFQRQLNLYGFQRLAGKGPDRGGYYHEYFLRGKVFLAHHIARTRVKGTRVRGRSNPSMEPNFYAMKPIGDVHNYDSSSVEEQNNKTSAVYLTNRTSTHRYQQRSPVTTPSIPKENSLPLDDDDLASCCGVFEGMHFHLLDSSDENTQKQADEAFSSKVVKCQEITKEEDMQFLASHLTISRELYRDIINTVDDEMSFGELLLRVIK